MLIKVTFSSFPSNNVVKTTHKWKNPFLISLLRETTDVTFKSSYLENLFSDMSSVSPWIVTYGETCMSLVMGRWNNSPKEEQTFSSAVDDHQPACHLTTCDSSEIYWRKITTWWFRNSVFVRRIQIVVEAQSTKLFRILSASRNFRADGCHTC